MRSDQTRDALDTTSPDAAPHVVLHAAPDAALHAVQFADVARRLGEAATSAGWIAPSFRSPPGLVGVNRTVRRRPGSDGAPVAAVRHRGRPSFAVMADMIEAVVVVNGAHSPESDRVRDMLWTALFPRSQQDGDRGVAAA